MNVHFIAIGGAAMHNLAIALHNKGYQLQEVMMRFLIHQNRDWKLKDCCQKLMVGFPKKSQHI